MSDIRRKRQKLTRALVYDESANLLLETGVAHFRLRDLASRLGVTVPNIYRYFSSREELITSTMTYAFVNATEEEVTRFALPLQPWETTEAFVSDILSRLRNEDAKAVRLRLLRMQALAATAFEDKSKEEISLVSTKVVDALTALFELAKSQQLLPESFNPRAHAYFLLCVRSGQGFCGLADDRGMDQDYAWSMYFKAMVTYGALTTGVDQ
jgi:AcrR family transcriptional regulator